MAKNDTLDPDEKIRLLRALAFQIHRKRPGDEVLGEMLGQESRGGRSRIFRPANETLTEQGFIAAMKVLGMVNDEAAILLDVIVDTNDHRVLSNALGKLADFIEGDR
ncbi:MAG: hypothetical protein H7Y60_12055 [Rhodospirillaceae bacterium]|nr:hypothetical protein [Rhodospirillales bacterium]